MFLDVAFIEALNDERSKSGLAAAGYATNCYKEPLTRRQLQVGFYSVSRSGSLRTSREFFHREAEWSPP